MLDTLINIFQTLIDPHRLLDLLTSIFTGFWAYAFLFFVLFAETGLLVGFFLPGDSLLFTLGVVAGAGGLNVWVLWGLLVAAAIIGDSVGYSLGRSIGLRAFSRPDTFFFRKSHLERTRRFYEKHGGKTIVYARFVPIVRTFAPFVAGVAEMNYKHFLFYNIFGGIGWVTLLLFLGYFMGDTPVVRNNFEKVIIAIIIISLLPPLIEYFRHRRSDQTKNT